MRTGQNRPTDLVKFHVYSDVLARVKEQAMLHGLTTTEAIGQGLSLWAMLAEAGFVGSNEFFYVCVKTPPSLAERIMSKIFGRKIISVVSQTRGVKLIGENLDATIERLLDDK